jgi:hypothetical protein
MQYLCELYPGKRTSGALVCRSMSEVLTPQIQGSSRSWRSVSRPFFAGNEQAVVGRNRIGLYRSSVCKFSEGFMNSV